MRIYQPRDAGRIVRIGESGLSVDAVVVKNDTEVDRERYAILGIDDVLVEPDENLREFQTRPVFVCSEPDILLHIGRFAILLQPIEAGSFGLACIHGICAVQVARYETAGHSFADIEHEETGRLKELPYGGAEVLWIEEITEEEEDEEEPPWIKWAVVRLGSFQGTCFAKLNGDLKGLTELGAYGYAEATIWRRSLTSPYLWEETESTLTVYAPPFLGEDETIMAGNWVEIRFVKPDRRPYVMSTTGEVLRECTP